MFRSQPELVADLQGVLSGAVLSAPADRRRFATDFGGVGPEDPAVVVQPRDTDDLRRALEVAARHGARVSLRGSAHSCRRQTLCGGGLVIDLKRADPGLELHPDGTVTVEGGARWLDVEARLNAAGRSVPVLPDYLDLTVGGTLSVGGYGATSIRRGAQIDHVDRLRLVTWAGEVRWCSRTEDPELFRFALGGQGLLGVIDRVVLRTAPAQRRTVLLAYAHRSTEELVETLQELIEGRSPLPGGFSAHVTAAETSSQLFLHGNEGDPPAARAALPNLVRRRFPSGRAGFRDYPIAKHHSQTRWLGGYPDTLHLWADHLVAPDQLGAYLAEARELCDASGLWPWLSAMYLLACQRPADAVDAPFVPSCGVGGAWSVGVGLYFMVPSAAGEAGTSRVHALLRQVQGAALARGARPYLYGWNDLDDAARARLWGRDLDRARALAAVHDPHGLRALGAR